MTLGERNRGREVACQPLGIFFRALSKKELPPETLCEGTGHAPAQFLDDRNHISWDAYRAFMTNVGRVFEDDQIVQMGRDLCRRQWKGPRGPNARLFYRPQELYARLVRAGSELLPISKAQRVTVEEELGWVRAELEMQFGYERSPEHDLLWRGMLEAVPRAMGLPLARVEATSLDRSTLYDVELPSQAGWFSGLRRLASHPFATHRNLVDLRLAHAQLRERYRQLEEQVTERRWVENVVWEQESRLRVATEQIPAVLWTTDRELVFTSSTGAGLTALGLQKGQVVGMTIQEFFQNDDPRFLPVASHFKALVGEAANYDFDWDGNTFQTHLEPLHDENGRITGVIGIALDISEHRQLEEQLRASQKMEAMGTLAGGIAHDFNNILASILGNAQMCLADAEQDTLLHGNLREIYKAGTRAKNLVGQILQFSRGSDRRREVIRLQDVVDDALRFMRASLPTLVQIHRRLGEDFVEIEADSAQLYQVVVNLCSNAAHAMRDSGGTLTVAVDEVDLTAEAMDLQMQLHPGRYARLVVADEGYGMPEAIADRIFDPFFTTKKSGQGSGMGLSVAYGIVKSHRGDIAVESIEGQGTKVTVHLPLWSEPARESRADEVGLPRGSGRVLFVDDEQAIVRVARQMLEFLGYEVVACTSGTEAWERFEADPDGFVLVMTDQSMPDITGDALARQIMGFRPETPVILCSGYSERITEAQAKAMGIREYLSKPVLLEKLAEVVHEVLEGTRV